MVRSESVTEVLKAKDPMKWVGLMNSIRAAAEEILLGVKGVLDFLEVFRIAAE